jgi:toxin FitB
MKWRVLRSWGPNRTTDLARWRQRAAVLAYDESVAEKWGHLRTRMQRCGWPRPHNDTGIATCCLIDNLPLATLNTKDFADSTEHEGLAFIGGQEP